MEREYNFLNWHELEEKVDAMYVESDKLAFAAMSRIVELIREQNKNQEDPEDHSEHTSVS